MRVVVARQDSILRDRLRQELLGLGLDCRASDCVSFEDLPTRLGKEPVDLVLVGLGSDPREALKIVEQTYEKTRAPIFAIGLSSDSENILQALRSGAREYIHENDFREELLAALKKLRQAGMAAPRWGKVLSVMGAQGGLGVTTVASNVAFALAGIYPERVVLAELGNSVPQLALNLDLNPPHQLDALTFAWDRLDVTMLRQALVTHPAKLSVLAHPPETLAPVKILPDAMRNVVVLLRSMFDFSVIDLGYTLDGTSREALSLADRVLVVLRLDVPSLRLSRQFLKQLEEVGVPSDKMHLIVNRFGQRQQFSWKKAQEGIGRIVTEWIPDDPSNINKAINVGQPLVKIARGATITRRFNNLAKQLNGQNK